MATVGAYPDRTSVYWLKQIDLPPDFDAVTTTHEYQDGGMSFNVSNDTGVQGWELTYDGLTVAQAAVLDAHYLSAGLANDFSFTDRLSVVQTGCHYKSYEKDWNKYGAQSRRVRLIKFPA